MFFSGKSICICCHLWQTRVKGILCQVLVKSAGSSLIVVIGELGAVPLCWHPVVWLLGLWERMCYFIWFYNLRSTHTKISRKMYFNEVTFVSLLQSSGSISYALFSSRILILEFQLRYSDKNNNYLLLPRDLGKTTPDLSGFHVFLTNVWSRCSCVS